MKKHILKKLKPRSGSLKLPKIYRFITDSGLFFIVNIGPFKRILVWRAIIGTLLGVVILTAIGISGFSLYLDLQNRIELDRQRQKIISEIQHWQQVVKKYQGYRDAYFQLARLEYRLRDFDKAKFYLDKALALDPNFEKGRELERVLSINQ